MVAGVGIVVVVVVDDMGEAGVELYRRSINYYYCHIQCLTTYGAFDLLLQIKDDITF